MHLLNRHYSKVFAEFLLMWIAVGVTSAPAALICFLLEQKVPGNPLLVVFASLIVFSLFMYTMPSLIACLSEHPSRTGVYFLNFALGWTALGWIAAMCWAYSGFNARIADLKARDAAASYVPQISKIPAFCGVLLFVAAIIGGEWTSALNPHPSSQAASVPMEAHEQQVAPLLSPASCIVVDTYRNGMSVQEFETEYMKRYHQQLTCSSRTNMNGENETSCSGALDIGTVHTTAQFHFGEGKLFAVDGFFDPAAFNDIKRSFTASYGNPDGDQACEMGSMNASELNIIAQHGGCEGLFWKRGPTTGIVMLSQFDG